MRRSNNKKKVTTADGVNRDGGNPNPSVEVFFIFFRICTSHLKLVANNIKEHAAFKILLSQKHPTAVEAWESFQKSKDQANFFRSLLKAVAGVRFSL